ncbi:MAG: hypothetical protein PHI12_14720 [Dehalococcoidales bacterium]|nr:hypothetical protein [Dehalococcoidales bacterium]
MKLCPDQETCTLYERRDNLPKNHDVRTKYKCMYWQGECTKQGDACNLDKIKRIKEGLSVGKGR